MPLVCNAYALKPEMLICLRIYLYLYIECASNERAGEFATNLLVF